MSKDLEKRMSAFIEAYGVDHESIQERINGVGIICGAIMFALRDNEPKIYEAVTATLLGALQKHEAESHPERLDEIRRFLAAFGIHSMPKPGKSP